MTDEEKFCCGWGIGRNAYFYTKCPCGRLAVTPSKNTLSVQSGEGVQTVEAVPAYLYQDNNYFMLRDLGKILAIVSIGTKRKTRLL